MVLASKSSAQHNHRRFLVGEHLSRQALLLVASLVTGILGYLLHAVLGRLLDPGDYGAVAAVIALSSILFFPTQIITTVTARVGATLSAGGQVGEIHDLMRRLMVILAPIGIGVAVVLVLVSKPIARFLQLNSARDVMILSAAFGVAFVMPINLGVMQGLQRFRAFSALLVLPVFLRLVLAGGLVMCGLGVPGAILGISLSAVISYIVSFYPVRDLLRISRVSIRSLHSLRASGLTTTVALGSTILLYNLDILLAKHFLAEQSAGLYAALATVGKIVLAVGNGVIVVVFPRFVAAHNKGDNPLRIVVFAVTAVTILGLIVEVPFLVAPALVMRVLVGNQYTTVAGQLGLYGGAMLAFAVAQVFVYYFLATSRRLFTLAILGCCVLQTALFALWHDSVPHLVDAVLLSMCLLLLALLCLFVGRSERGHA